MISTRPLLMFGLILSLSRITTLPTITTTYSPPEFLRPAMDGGALLFIENDLNDAFPVAQVDEGEVDRNRGAGEPSPSGDFFTRH